MTEPDTQTAAVEPLVDRLIQASIGGCSCQTKSPELRWHDPLCHFRLFSECIEAIGGMETARRMPLPSRDAERAKLRPANFLNLSPKEQWAIDKDLGILDWDGDQ